MLDPESPEERREQIAADARQRIESGGSLKHDAAWGMRKMAYEIRQRTEADYRFFRFSNGGGSLLDELNHNLRIADGVLRFRIFKVDPSSPATEPPPPVSLAASAPPRGGRRGDGPPRQDDAPPPQEAPSADAPAAEAPRPRRLPPAEAPAPEAPAEAPAEEPPAPEAPAEEPAEEPPAPDPPEDE